MASDKRYKRVIVLSDIEDSDEDYHQSHPKKRPRLPEHQYEGGFQTGQTSRDPDHITSISSSSHDSSINVIVVSDDEDYTIGEGTTSPKRLRTCDHEAADSSEDSGSLLMIVESDDDDDYVIVSPPSTVTESSESLESLEVRSPSEDHPTCNIRGCFIEDITSPGSPYLSDFQQTKHHLASRLFKWYNWTIFENQLPESIIITWSKRLTATSAFCINICQDGQRHSTIELSEKVCDSADRLRDTLVHEMCHAACWHFHGVQNDGHGPLWMLYTQKAMDTHPELPPITAHHTYSIKYRFNYECENCECRVGRFRRIIEERAICKKCRCKLQLQNTI
ncbi:germ cell nuclear acidic protein-like [Anomaloglossus baeobatrachus]|uniref:germ cell nuclear acidic protein-like n=1 Tax=Anomaloglossus baeobatrachus TaxID=238106 RepID=UPI003F4FA387